MRRSRERRSSDRLGARCARRGLLAAIGILLVATTACGLAPETPSGLACQDPPTADEVLGDRKVPQLTGMTPDAAGQQLERAGIPASWRYEYATDPNDPRVGYAECWCEPPPDGLVRDIIAEPDAQLIVFVERSEPIVGGRPQPLLGWDCDEE